VVRNEKRINEHGGERRRPMGKKDGAKLVSEKAKDYFNQGFN